VYRWAVLLDSYFRGIIARKEGQQRRLSFIISVGESWIGELAHTLSVALSILPADKPFISRTYSRNDLGEILAERDTSVTVVVGP